MPTAQHIGFQNRLKPSSKAVFAVARYLHTIGYAVEIPGMHIAPEAKDQERYQDKGDLFVIETPNRIKVKWRFEVKGSSSVFSGAHDYPFEGGVIVASKDPVDRSGKEVVRWIRVSNDLTCAAVIDGNTKDKWFLTERKMSNTGNIEKIYVAPLKIVKWYNIGV